MRITFPRGLPTRQIGLLSEHPEPYHLQVLHAMARRCGPAPILVEQGVTSGHVTFALLEAARALPGARLVLLGEVPPHVLELCQGTEILTELPAGAPSLWFIGKPELALQGVQQALECRTRIVVLYDTRTAERFGMNRFIPAQQAARQLQAVDGRDWNSLSNAIQGQQTRRGMFISEMHPWRPTPVIEEPIVESLGLPDPEPALPRIPNNRFSLGLRKSSLPGS